VQWNAHGLPQRDLVRDIDGQRALAVGDGDVVSCPCLLDIERALGRRL